MRQDVYARRVTLTGGVSATCVVARERQAPAGVKPLEWHLLSHREGVDFASAIQLIDGHHVRWEIERLFHIVKNACRNRHRGRP